VIIKDGANDGAYPHPGDENADEQTESGEGDVGDENVYPAPSDDAAQPEAVPAASGDGDETLPTPAPDIPEPKTEMEASNPETVSLGSGEIQLVEFFAFW